MSESEQVSLSLWEIETDIMLGRIDAAGVFEKMKETFGIVEMWRDEACDERDQWHKDLKEAERGWDEAERARSGLVDALLNAHAAIDCDCEENLPTVKGIESVCRDLNDALERFNPDTKRGETLTDALKRARAEKKQNK